MSKLSLAVANHERPSAGSLISRRNHATRRVRRTLSSVTELLIILLQMTMFCFIISSTAVQSAAACLQSPIAASVVVDEYTALAAQQTLARDSRNDSSVVASPATEVFARGAIAADHPAASEAGAIILRQGGNVVDAAVATSFALSVVRPASCGIGGGGFMVIWDASKKQAVTIDYRERAPAAATRNMYINGLAENGPLNQISGESGSVRGASAAAIPGTVAGLCLAAQQYGTLPLSTLVQPAIDLCEEGVLVDDHDIEVQAVTLAKLQKYEGYSVRFALLKRLYLNNGIPWKPGDRFHSPQKRVLKLIAQHGSDGFYRGPVARSIVELMKTDGGFLTEEDLRTEIPILRVPLIGQFYGHSVICMPPPSSGGVALLQTLNTLQKWEQQADRKLISLGHNSTEYVHVVSEALKHAFADRAEFLGDTDFAQVPVNRLLSANYAQQQAARIKLNTTLPPGEYGRFFSQPDGGTSHFSVMDHKGNAVACTETINLTFGSFAVVPEYGIILNNQMDDFAANPGLPNAFGLIQSEANAIAAGKKPLSSMTPTIVVEDGKAILACGGSGGPRIITATLQVILNNRVFRMSAKQSVDADRFHHQWFPNELLLEPDLGQMVKPILQQWGHQCRTASSLAAAQSTILTDKGVQAGSDVRKHGRPAGY